MDIAGLLRKWFLTEPREYREECDAHIAQTNRARVLPISIAICATVALLLAFSLYGLMNSEQVHPYEWYRLLGYAGLIVVFPAAGLVLGRPLSAESRFTQVAYAVVGAAAILCSVWLSVLNQFDYCSITAYVTICFVLAVVFIVRPSYAAACQLGGYAALCCALPRFQSDPKFLAEQIVSAGFVCGMSIVISRMRYKTHLDSLINSITIDKQNRILKNLAAIDEVTGIYNRRKFNELMHQSWNNATRIGFPVSLIIFDIDYFKQYNDSYGHLKGDECLKLLADTVKSKFRRANESYARFGGEEFVILLTYCDEEKLTEYCASLIDVVDNLKIPHKSSPIGQHLSVSAGGVSTYPRLGDSMEAFIQCADAAMYAAKQNGRHQYTIGKYEGVGE